MSDSPRPLTEPALAVAAVALALADLYKAEGVAIWLLSPHPAFGGRSAAELWVSGEQEAVLAELDRLTSGSFA